MYSVNTVVLNPTGASWCPDAQHTYRAVSSSHLVLARVVRNDAASFILGERTLAEHLASPVAGQQVYRGRRCQRALARTGPLYSAISRSASKRKLAGWFVCGSAAWPMQR